MDPLQERGMTQQLRNTGIPQLGLCVLCGLPAAGKTTMAKALIQSLTGREGRLGVLLSYDDLIPPEVFSQSETSSGPDGQQSLVSRVLLAF